MEKQLIEVLSLQNILYSIYKIYIFHCLWKNVAAVAV